MRWRWDVAALIVLLAIAVPLRFIHLGTTPPGFHGDESAMGTEAERILQRGWIGVYSGESGGTPSGPYYAVAASVWVFGRSIFAARFASAVIDTLTMLAFYGLMRRHFGTVAAAAGGFFFAVSAWQIQFARLAFINSSWTLAIVLATIALGEAARRPSRFWWLITGVLAASGLYAYPGHLLFLGVFALFAAGYFLWALIRPPVKRFLTVQCGVCLGAGFLVAAWPMIQFARRQREVYFRTGRGVSVFETPEWKGQIGLFERAHFLFSRYLEFWNRLLLHPRPDGIDGSGGAPLVPVLAMAACIAGIPFAWRSRNRGLAIFGLLVIGLMPLATATSNQYPLRRSLAISPFIAMFAAIAIAALVRWTWVRRRGVRWAGLAVATVWLGSIAYTNLDNYFDKTVHAGGMYWTMGAELTDSVAFMKSEPPDVYFYFFSQRWSFDHEVRTFLDPDARGESRGAEFGENSLAIDWSNGSPVVILIGDYKNLLPVYQIMYPNSSFALGPKDDPSGQIPAYIAFFPRAPRGSAGT